LSSRRLYSEVDVRTRKRYEKEIRKPACKNQGQDGSFDIGAPTVQDSTFVMLLSDNSWEFIVMKDHTQSPAREETKKMTLRVLQEQ
jgi:hypothetical protein